MRNYPKFAIAIALVLLIARNSVSKGSRGFRLPDGDVEKGKAAFLLESRPTSPSMIGSEGWRYF